MLNYLLIDKICLDLGMKLSVTQYAIKLNKTRQAILWQIKNNKLPDGVKAEKVGNSWIINLKTK